MASRVATAFWGATRPCSPASRENFGALIEAVNQVGSLFYGGMLGVFVLAFFVTKRRRHRRVLASSPARRNLRPARFTGSRSSGTT